jgi:hypothetical protein
MLTVKGMSGFDLRMGWQGWYMYLLDKTSRLVLKLDHYTEREWESRIGDGKLVAVLYEFVYPLVEVRLGGLGKLWRRLEVQRLS